MSKLPKIDRPRKTEASLSSFWN